MKKLAVEMFDAIGYPLVQKDEECIRYSKAPIYDIYFYVKRKTMAFDVNIITMEMWNAINQQVKELNWNVSTTFPNARVVIKKDKNY